MKRLFQKRLQLQLLFALIALASVAGLTVELIADALEHAEGFVLGDTSRTLHSAIQELGREYRLRVAGDLSWRTSPSTAQDLSLRAISETVLSSFPGVEGGFATGSQFLGYSFPTHDGGSPKIDVPAAERQAIEEVIGRSRARGTAERVLRGRRDLVVIAAANSGGTAVWAMKRLPGQADPANRTRNILVTALICAALLGAAGVLATGVGLHRGVSEIKSGLNALHTDFTHGLPERHDELGEICTAINQMARVRRSLESELRREDRLRTTGRLVARIAHEMRNPLNSIRLSLQMLQNRHSQSKLKAEDFRIVIDEVDRMNRLLTDLLAFQQPRPPRTGPAPMRPLLAECSELVRPQADKLKVSIVLAKCDETSAAIDEHYFKQVMMNLLLNALEVSAPGDRVQVRASVSDGVIEIHVSDQGPGLSAEQQEHLFEPFFTTKANGHGLGLAVSRELAQSMGGDLSYRPGAHGGAVFVLSLKGVANGS